MKIGPNWFPTTYTGATGQTLFPNQMLGGVITPTATIFNTQNMNATFTSLPVDGRGLYDLTVQMMGTFSAITIVEVDMSIDPNSVSPNASTATWFSIGTIASTPTVLIHTGIKRAIRCKSVAVSGTDNFSVMFMADDRG